MAMDLTIARYDTWDDLLGYMDGSAAVIGEMMLPILEPSTPAALPHARDLGFAFQLTNFLRDVERGPRPGPGLPASARTSPASAPIRAGGPSTRRGAT